MPWDKRLDNIRLDRVILKEPARYISAGPALVSLRRGWICA